MLKHVRTTPPKLRNPDVVEYAHQLYVLCEVGIVLPTSVCVCARVFVSLSVCVSVCTKMKKTNIGNGFFWVEICYGKPKKLFYLTLTFDLEICFNISSWDYFYPIPICETCRLATQQTL